MRSVPGLAGHPKPSVVRVVSRATKDPELDDVALVAAVRAGEPWAPARIWDRHSSLARRLLRRSLGPGVDVEDALQEVFLRLFRDLGSLRDAAALRSFVFGITLHVATSELRRRRARRWLLLSDDGLSPVTEAIEDAHLVEQRQALYALYRILDRMDTKRRLAFVLRHVEGLELTELATALECSLATAKRRVAEASERVSLLASRDPHLSHYVRAP